MPLPAVRLVNGHPDDQTAEESALAALRAGEPPYRNEWPRETAMRYLNALSSGDESRVRVATAPTEKDLSNYLRPPLTSRVTTALWLFEAILGSDRVASEIVSYFERGSSDEDGVLTAALVHLREHMPQSDRSRLDARLRVLTRTSDTPRIEEVLRRRPSKPPSKSNIPVAAVAAAEPAPAAKPPAKKKAAKKKK
jgi:hypothetical protein